MTCRFCGQKNASCGGEGRCGLSCNESTSVSPVTRMTALDRFGDPVLLPLPGMTDPCEDCPSDRVCRRCLYSAAVRVLYCREERCEARPPVPPRFLPDPAGLFFPAEEDYVDEICAALLPRPERNGHNDAQSRQ